MTATEVEQILDWLEIEDMDWSRIAGAEGVSTKILWRDPAGISSAGGTPEPTAHKRLPGLALDWLLSTRRHSSAPMPQVAGVVDRVPGSGR